MVSTSYPDLPLKAAVTGYLAALRIVTITSPFPVNTLAKSVMFSQKKTQNEKPLSKRRKSATNIMVALVISLY